MSDMRPRLSVIMPCYNVADTLDRAVQSIFMQQVDFPYEIIMVDDASTDDTAKMLDAYEKKYPQVRVIRHEENQGNAIAFYNGLSAAQGDYFCVLDGDDYYTMPDKFQKQVDFLDGDCKHRYVGCCHYFIIDVGNGNVSVPDCVAFDEFNYTDYLTRHSGYFHTATHMYRNIFRGKAPEYYRQKIYRGDSPRTLFHLMFSGGQIRILNFVGSVYTFTYKGIWSSMDQKKQFEYQINMVEHFNKTAASPTEHVCLEYINAENKKKLQTAKDQKRQYPEKTIEECLTRIHRYTQLFAFRERDYLLQHVYASEYIDTLCASLGVLYRQYHPESIQRETQKKHLVILMWQLNPYAGGLFREIDEMVRMYKDWQIKVIVTDRSNDVEPVRQIWKDLPHVQLTKVPEDCPDRLDFISKEICNFQPEKLYDYCGHVDVFSTAAIQPGVCRNVCLFSYDHGYLTGLYNPFLDRIVAKRPAYYTLLTHSLDRKKIIYIPTWNIPKPLNGLVYQPFKEHEKIITSTGAARFYKLEGGWPYCYTDYVIALLAKTGGIHYHFGPIPEETMQEIHEKMERAGVRKEQFVQLDWVENLPAFCLEHNVDVFIEPFPTVSYKMTLDMLFAGIPVIALDSVKRMTTSDFLYEGAMYWHSEEQFLNILSSVTAQELQAQSDRAKKYFAENHSLEVIWPHLQEDTSLRIPDTVEIADPNILEIRDQKRLYLDIEPIKVMGTQNLNGNPNRPGIPQKGTEEQKAAEKKEEKKNQEEARIRAKAEQLRRSRSYRLGYAVTFPLRFVKRFAAVLCREGWARAWSAVRGSDALHGRKKNAKEDLYYVEHCCSMKVGRALTAPWRGLKKLYQNSARAQTKTMYQQVNRLAAQMEKDIKAVTQKIDKLQQNEIQELARQTQKIASQQIDQNGLLSKQNARMDATEKEVRISQQLIRQSAEKQRQMIPVLLKRTVLEHLDYHLVEHCNLNCKCCSTFSPVAPKSFSSPEQFEKDMQRLHELIGDRVSQIHLLGGEPLLHPQAEEFAKICRKIYSQARIDFTTNGLLVAQMPETFWQCLRENDVAIKYTQYPIPLDYQKMEEFVRSKGVRVLTAGGEKAISTFRRIPINPKGTFNACKSYVQCPYVDCAQLWNGKLYRCPASAYSGLINQKLIEEKRDGQGLFKLTREDYLDIFETQDGKAVMDFVSGPIPFCQYCDMDHIKNIPWEQSDGSISDWVDFG